MRGRSIFLKYLPVILSTSLLSLLIFHLVTIYPLTYGINGGYYTFIIREIQKGKLNFLLKYPVSFGIFYIFSKLFRNVSLGIKIPSLIFLVITSYLIPLLIDRNIYKKNNLDILLIILTSLSSWNTILLLNGFYKQIIALPFLILSLYTLDEFLKVKKVKNLIYFSLSSVFCYFSHIPIFLFLLLNTIMFLFFLPILKKKDKENRYKVSNFVLLLIGVIIFFVLTNYLPYIKTVILSNIGNQLIERMRLIFLSKEDFGKFILIIVPVVMTMGRKYRLALIFNVSYIIIWFISPNDWFWRINYIEFIPISIGVVVIFKFLSVLFKRKSISLLIVLIIITFLNFSFLKNPFNIPENFGPIITIDEYNELISFFSHSKEIKNYELFAEHGLNYWISLTSDIECGEIHSKGDGNIRLTLGRIKNRFDPNKPVLLVSKNGYIDRHKIIKSREIWKNGNVRVEIYPFFTEKFEIYFYSKNAETLSYEITFCDPNNRFTKYIKGSCFLNSDGIGRVIIDTSELEEGKYKLVIAVSKDEENTEAIFIVKKKNKFFPFLNLPSGSISLKYKTKNFSFLKLNTYKFDT